MAGSAVRRHTLTTSSSWPFFWPSPSAQQFCDRHGNMLLLSILAGSISGGCAACSRTPSVPSLSTGLGLGAAWKPGTKPVRTPTTSAREREALHRRRRSGRVAQVSWPSLGHLERWNTSASSPGVHTPRRRTPHLHRFLVLVRCGGRRALMRPTSLVRAYPLGKSSPVLISIAYHPHRRPRFGL